MGRKTWESIPTRFRPLKDRTNIVISRNPSAESCSGGILANSIESALESIPEGGAEKVFVIGGAQIYREALQKAQAKRILLTRVLSDFECDTFFPITLGENGKGEGWVRRTKEELDAWVGESVVEGTQVENGTSYVFEMWERIEDTTV
ncbi:Dihydrofolate reductase [Hyphodiscus hymeniophilus]|uniref:Dihydrofolate reductase n=1 Tax=Hyphodiscus hymeniophilus TaxID=353542 RepID=A0A9P6VH00_9HELO|nr:Dihydrofolate reductase [Hyphodiscus hymeniophilus]